MKNAFKSTLRGCALALVMVTPFMAGAAVVNDSYVSDVSGRVSASAVSYELFNLGNTTGGPSISFAQALSNSALNLSTYGATGTSNWQYSNYTYDDQGNQTGYTRTLHTQTSVSAMRTNDFSLSAHSMVVFTVNAGGAGNADLCTYKCPQYGVNTPFAMAGATGDVRLQVLGTGYSGTGGQSAEANFSGGGVLATNSSPDNLSNFWGVSGSGNVYYHYTDDPDGTTFLSGYTYSRNGLLQVAFLNLSDSAIDGTLNMWASAREETYGFGQVVAVPEPSTAVMLALGLALLTVRRRRMA